MYRSLMTTLNTILGFDTSEQAQFRFHVLKVFYEGGCGATNLVFPKLSRATLYRWKKSYEGSGKKLNSLIPKSTRPHKVRLMQTHPAIVALVTQLRKTYPRMGKNKIKLFVDQFCQRENFETIKASTIGKVIKRNKLFYAGKGSGRRQRKSAPKPRVRFCPKPGSTGPGYIQLDGVKFFYLDKYYYFLTAVDIVTKQAWVKLVSRANSRAASELLRDILETAYYKVHTIQTDNGSEFKAYFDQACSQAGLKHLFSFPKQPKTNGYVERFNWTIQDEFIFSYEDLLLYPEDFKKELATWLDFYNNLRPHQSLDYLTPYQYYQKGGLSHK